MANKCTYDEYMEQYVTENGMNIVSREIGLDNILASECPHFNPPWDSGIDRSTHPLTIKNWDRLPSVINKEVEALLRANGDNLAPATYVCVAKACARQLKLSNEST